MEISFVGHACFRLRGREAAVMTVSSDIYFTAAAWVGSFSNSPANTCLALPT